MKLSIKILLLSFFIFLSGCASTSGSSQSYIDKNLFAQFKFGNTTKEQVMELLGEPVHIDNNKDGRSVLLYDISSTKTSGLMFSKEGVLNKIVDFAKD